MNYYSVETSDITFPRNIVNYSSVHKLHAKEEDLKYTILDNPLDEFNSIIYSIFTKKSVGYSSLINESVPMYPTETFLYNFKFLDKINFQNQRKINKFLTKHSDIIIDFLLGCQVAIETFGQEYYDLSVEEGDIDGGYLLLSVILQRYEPGVLNNLNKIFESYSDDIKGKSAYFVVTADFQ